MTWFDLAVLTSQTGVVGGMSSRSEPADDVFARAIAARQQARALASHLSLLAGWVAETELRLAASLEQIAADKPDRADALLAMAHSAREFAERERFEQRRLRQAAEDQA